MRVEIALGTRRLRRQRPRCRQLRQAAATLADYFATRPSYPLALLSLAPVLQLRVILQARLGRVCTRSPLTYGYKRAAKLAIATRVARDQRYTLKLSRRHYAELQIASKRR